MIIVAISFILVVLIFIYKIRKTNEYFSNETMGPDDRVYYEQMIHKNSNEYFNECITKN